MKLPVASLVPQPSPAVAPIGGGSAACRTAVALAAAALILLAHAANPREVSSEQLTRGEYQDPSQHLGFSFARGTCEQGPEFCAVTTPRAWAPAEIELVRAALDDVAASELGGRIVERAVTNGFRTVRRYAQAARVSASGRYEAQPMIVAAAHSDDARSPRTIDVTDRFFERGSVRDHFSGEPGYLLTTEILTHELVHAVDFDQRYSGAAEFRRVARLGMPTAQQDAADRANVERERLNAEGRYEEAWRVSRSFAIVTLRGRLPSVHTLDNYREAFAEFGAHLVLDRNARTQFEPRVVQYLERAVSEER
jgi:hypothetical protein